MKEQTHVLNMKSMKSFKSMKSSKSIKRASESEPLDESQIDSSTTDEDKPKVVVPHFSILFMLLQVCIFIRGLIFRTRTCMSTHRLGQPLHNSQRCRLHAWCQILMLLPTYIIWLDLFLIMWIVRWPLRWLREFMHDPFKRRERLMENTRPFAHDTYRNCTRHLARSQRPMQIYCAERTHPTPG
jgi:hypothetical protein